MKLRSFFYEVRDRLLNISTNFAVGNVIVFFNSLRDKISLGMGMWPSLRCRVRRTAICVSGLSSVQEERGVTNGTHKPTAL